MTAETQAASVNRRRPWLARTWSQVALIRESKVGMIGVIIILFWIVIALIADVIAPYDPNTSVNARFVDSFSSAPISPGAYQDLTVRVYGLPDEMRFDGATLDGSTWVVPGRLAREANLIVPEGADGTISLSLEAHDGDGLVTQGAMTLDIDALLASSEADVVEEEDPYAAYGQAQSDPPADDQPTVAQSYDDAYGTPSNDVAPLDATPAFPVDLTEKLEVWFAFGTDHLGRDILTRIIHGSRTVLIYAPIATFCAYVVGILLGLAAGYYRGWMDTALSFVGNVILAFPVLVLYIITITLIGASGLNIVIAVTFASAPGIMRIVRGLTLDLRTREYIAAAQTRGESAWYIMIVELLPNARGPLIVDACLRLGYVTITIGVLGFLGLGLPPPDPDWGGMVNDARNNGALSHMHTALFPCLAISSLVLGLNLLADGLREVSLKD